MARYLTVAVAQCAAQPGDLAANARTHRDFIGRAKAVDADVLVFPELSMVGHTGADNILDVAIPASDARLADLSRLAGDMEIIVGFIEEGPSAQFYNSAAILRNGTLVYLHRKVNIPSYGQLDETKHYSSGRFVDVHRKDDDWIVGLLVCADLYNPALAHLSFLHGATVLVAPISSGREAVGPSFDNPGSWNTTLNFYAMMYGAPVVMANRVGQEGALSFWGGSRIIDARGAVVAQGGDREELIFAKLDYADTRKARAQLPTVRDSNISLVHRETSRLIENLGVPVLVRPSH